jgi:predicted GIY-YIG superfamily endonuclease
MNSYRVYMLQNPKRSFYIGFSENVDVRVQQHNAGMSRSIRSKGPWRIVWQSDALTLPPCASTRTRTQKTKRRKRLLSEDRSAEILKIAPRRGGAAPATKPLAARPRLRQGHADRTQRENPA